MSRNAMPIQLLQIIDQLFVNVLIKDTRVIVLHFDRACCRRKSAELRAERQRRIQLLVRGCASTSNRCR